MSYVNSNTLKMQKRRHGVKWVTPEEAVVKANEAIDEANNHIARALTFAATWQQVAADLDKENRELRAKVAELERENSKLKRMTRPKAGKRRDDWEADEQIKKPGG